MTSEAQRILVVDDDDSMRDLLSSVLTVFGTIDTAANGQEARAKFQVEEYAVILLDYMLPDADGLTLLKEFKELQPQTEIVMITHVREVKLAVQAIKHGAFDYINKDFEVEDLRALLQRAFEKRRHLKEILYLRSEVERLTDHEFLLGVNPRMQALKTVLDRAASTSATVLIQGESGTGKELVARYLHQKSPRVDKPFVAINMASIPEHLVESTLFGHEKGAFTGALKTTYGKFELADQGTLFCDEIADLKFEVQAKLLRAIQEGEVERVGGQKPIHVDVRLLAATNRDLKKLVQEGKFREDLFYRLNVIPIQLPALRERLEDIPLFVDLFLKRYNRKFGRNLRFSPEAISVLCHYDWPGNIRELENLVERLVAIHPGDTILPEDVPIDYQISDIAQLKSTDGDPDKLKVATDAFERGFILRVLEKEHWHQENAALKLGVHRKTLEYKLKKLNLTEVVDQRQLESKRGST
ncbi:sigma-54-dependent Fis family transcriptional regulator [Deltaproteobacteria bacterium PRO3]|nr:sigma-54-dependent Fis family transcriptional regulator [Deltaproteobacteria bacterium PRO3]